MHSTQYSILSICKLCFYHAFYVCCTLAFVRAVRQMLFSVMRLALCLRGIHGHGHGHGHGIFILTMTVTRTVTQ
jgi:hypothetical protein